MAATSRVGFFLVLLSEVSEQWDNTNLIEGVSVGRLERGR